MVLYDEQAGRGWRVVTCSHAGRAHGIQPGMPVVEATSLVRQSKTSPGNPGLHLERYDPRQDRSALEELAAWCDQFSPIVGLEEEAEPACLFMDVSGMASIFGSEEQLAHNGRNQFRHLHLLARVAIAETLGAAWGAARFVATAEQPFVAPAAANNLVRESSATGSWHEHLPVEALRLPAATIQRLHQLGITQLRQLANLPPRGLLARFGDTLVTRLRQFFGECQEGIVPHRPPEPMVAQIDLEHPTAHHATVEHLVSQLVADVARQLTARQAGALQLECQLQCEGREAVKIAVTLFEPAAEARHLEELLLMQLNTLALPGAVQSLAIHVRQHATQSPRQHVLFDEQTRQHVRQLATLVDRLAGRLGSDRVVQLELLPDAQPEHAVQKVSLAAGKIRFDHAGHEPFRPLQRPLRLWHPPVPIEVVTTPAEETPCELSIRGQRHPLGNVCGPEEIVTGWWRGASVRRNYYRVETTAGSRFWVFRRLQDNAWFLHGEFE